MYLSFYNLTAKPFQISTDPKFLWLGEKHKEALAVLKYGILENMGFLLLTGDVGTGKTTLINTLTNSLGNDTLVAKVPDPSMERIDFFNFIASIFGMDGKFDSKGAFLLKFSEFLNDAYANNKKVLVVIDEAQTLNPELLEEIRLLSNIEKQDTKLLNIFFVGQNEFNTILVDNQNRALRQRITVNYEISPLTEKETGEYIKHRLKIAGSKKRIFTPDAISEIFAFSKGFPRLINIICNHALLTGFSRETKLLKADDVKECAQELRIKTPIDKKENEPEKTDTPPRRRRQTDFNSESNKEDINKTGKIWFVDRIAGYLALFALILISVWFFYNLGVFNNPGQDIKKQLNRVSKNINKTKPKNPPRNTSSPATKKVLKAYPIEKQYPASEIETYPVEKNNPKQETKTYKFNNRYPIPHGKTTIYFSHNSNEFPVEVLSTLDNVAKIMSHNSDTKVVITGYTDSLGSRDYNKYLSILRANMVKSYLVGKV
jgi:general secretion pathway protein A